MKVIICGVGRVGLSIASYLSTQDNDITVIDSSPDLVKRVSDTYDITGIVGHASEPAMLKKAGADDADIIIAVTDCDEVNMVACQVAHSVFGIHKKIARVRNNEYRDPAWSNLFSRDHMPIDVIISPEEEIADAILHRMSVPGTTNDLSLIDHKIHVFGLIVTEDNSLAGESIRDIYYANRDIDFRVLMVFDNGTAIDFDDSTILNDNFEIYILCEKATLFLILDRLGNDNDIYNGNIVIAGGGVIGEAISAKIHDHSILCQNNLVVIEHDLHRARHLNRCFPDILVLNGSALDDVILNEANVGKSAVFVSVMNSNENNILSGVLAKKMGAHYAISLSTNKLYNQLLPDRFIDAIVNPETITVSRILHNLRRGHIRSVNAIRDSGYEVIEAEVTNDCGIVDVEFAELHFPKSIQIVGVWNAQNGQFIYPTPKTVIKSGDIVIILSHNAAIKDVEKLFSFSINLF